MERLSIASFLTNGHEYHLYVYEEIENAPEGTVLKAANEILPESMIFQYKKYPSHAGFSNFFRYKLLLEKGGGWARGAYHRGDQGAARERNNGLQLAYVPFVHRSGRRGLG
jgi:mannosyltransferase OCH1-like enzyme